MNLGTLIILLDTIFSHSHELIHKLYSKKKRKKVILIDRKSIEDESSYKQ